MKYTLTIHADSVTELLDALNTATSTVSAPSIPDEPRVVPSAKSIPIPDEPRDVYDPRDVYGPGNGPVDAVRTAKPVEPTEPEQDLTGWDERIHAASKTRNSDGSWRKKRGVSEELVAAVEAELRNDVIDDISALNTTDTTDTTEAPTAAYTPQDVMRRLGELVTNGDFTPADIRQVATDCGLSEIVEIAQDYHALQRVTAYLREKAVM